MPRRDAGRPENPSTASLAGVRASPIPKPNSDPAMRMNGQYIECAVRVAKRPSPAARKPIPTAMSVLAPTVLTATPANGAAIIVSATAGRMAAPAMSGL